MINSAVLKLTAWYVSALMLVSVIFSLILFEVNSKEIDRNSRALPPIAAFQDPDSRAQFREDSQRRYEDSIERLVQNIIFLNIGTLVFGSIFSYLFARFTLQPVKEAMESQARFASDASHELRTPLTSMQTEIEVTLRDPRTSKEEYRKLLESNLEEIDVMKDMSSALLQLTRGEIAKEQFTTLSLLELIAQAIKRISPSATAKKITIKNDSKTVLPQINGEPLSLTELFVVLLDNAIKYSSRGSTITIAYSIHGKYISVMVQDQGQGITEKDMPYIFDRFYRSDESRTKTDSPGYGLGLSIARKIVDVHNARIDVTSIPKKGTTFTVTFLLAK